MVHGLGRPRDGQLGVARLDCAEESLECARRGHVDERHCFEVENEALRGGSVEQLDGMVDEVVGVGEEQWGIEAVDHHAGSRFQVLAGREFLEAAAVVGRAEDRGSAAISARSAAPATGTRR